MSLIPKPASWPAPTRQLYKPDDLVVLKNPTQFPLLDDLNEAAHGPAMVTGVTPHDPTGKASALHPGAYITFLNDAHQRSFHVLMEHLDPAPKKSKGV